MKPGEIIYLSRDCPGIQIPSGEAVVLPKGTGCAITQSLGGSFTLSTDLGTLVRVAGHDADALGLEPTPRRAEEADSAGPQSREKIEERVWEELKSCYDPEIPANIVDLGLIYACEVKESEGGYAVAIRMTLTAPGCGMGDILKRDIEMKVREVAGVKSVAVEVVLDPPWNSSMMTEAARLQLGFM